jgi:hypothetical protein
VAKNRRRGRVYSDGSETFHREQVEPDFSFITFGPDSWNPKDYNVDIEVHLPDGRRFAATFFTFERIKGLMRNYSQTVECDHGLYFWASDMILAEELTACHREDDSLPHPNRGDFQRASRTRERQRRRRIATLPLATSPASHTQTAIPFKVNPTPAVADLLLSCTSQLPRQAPPGLPRRKHPSMTPLEGMPSPEQALRRFKEAATLVLKTFAEQVSPNGGRISHRDLLRFSQHTRSGVLPASTGNLHFRFHGSGCEAKTKDWTIDFNMCGKEDGEIQLLIGAFRLSGFFQSQGVPLSEPDALSVLQQAAEQGLAKRREGSANYFLI